MAWLWYMYGFVGVTVAHAQYAPLILDNTAILSVPGRADVNPNGWGDSYSVGNRCYCETTFDHDLDLIVVSTPVGNKTIRQVCSLLGPGPGSLGRPRYNDIQCGNGPANEAGDETTCPGRIEYGQEGCKYIGPKWNWSLLSPVAPVTPPARASLTRAPGQSTNSTNNAPVKAPNRAPFTLAPVQAPILNSLYRCLLRFLARLFRG